MVHSSIFKIIRNGIWNNNECFERFYSNRGDNYIGRNLSCRLKRIDRPRYSRRECKSSQKTTSSGFRSFSRYKLDVIYPRKTVNEKTLSTKASLQVKYQIFRELEVGDTKKVYYISALPDRPFISPKELRYPWAAFHISLMIMLLWLFWFLRRQTRNR